MNHDNIIAQAIKYSAHPRKYKPMNSLGFGYPQNGHRFLATLKFNEENFNEIDKQLTSNLSNFPS